MIYFAGIADKPTYPGKYYNIAVSARMPYDRIRCLAPTYPMVDEYKHGRMTAEEYIEQYTDLMWQRRKIIEVRFSLIDPNEDQVWCCYCPEHHETGKRRFCHRILARRLLKHYRPDILTELH